MEIRPLRGRADARGVLRVARAAWRAAYAHIVDDAVLSRLADAPTPDDVDRWYAQLDPGPDGRVLVADSDSTPDPDLNPVSDPGPEPGATGADADPGDAPSVAGYAYVRWGDATKPFVDDGEAGLKELYVHPDHWREGVGSALLDRCLAAVPDGTSALELETLAENRRGRAFYEARGFECVGRASFELLGRTYPTAVYARRLG